MKKISSFLFLSLFGLLLPATSFSATQDDITFNFQVFKPDYSSPSRPSNPTGPTENNPFKKGTRLGSFNFKINKGNYTVSDLCDLIVVHLSESNISSDNFSLWTETNENNQKSYKQLKKDDPIEERSDFYLLVDRLSEAKFSALFPKPTNPTTNVQRSTNQRTISPKRGWTTMQVGSAVAATVVVISFAIGGVIYYFVLPKKRNSSLPPEKEVVDRQELEKEVA